jgi:hypothetical protein
MVAYRRFRSRTDLYRHERARSHRTAGTSAPDRTGQTEMSDGPTPDDFRAKVFRDRKHTEDWGVEKMDEDGSSEISIFSGPTARERAVRYANREYGAFDEIELEPYRRST